MQSRRQKFRSWPLTWLLTALGATALLAGTPLASTRAAAANTAPPPSLYTALVPDSEPQRAAQLAMREVLVRLVGSRSAPDDPAFAGLIEDARRYVQIERGTTQGATQVIFDAAALRAALAAAGSSVWEPDRPLLWVVLPAVPDGVTDDLRAQLNAAAQLRGLPIAVVSAQDASAGPAAVLGDARRAGAAAALIGQPSDSDPTLLQWTLVAPIAEGHWVGGAAAAIDGATDAMVHASRQIDGAPLAEFDCRIAGVLDLASFTAVLNSVSSAPGVSDVALRTVAADQITLHLKVRGGAAALARALIGERLRPAGASGDGSQQYRYQAGS
jgi:hypothetical protein